MPVFYFDSDDGYLRHRDGRGVKLRSIQIAERQADKLVVDLALIGSRIGGAPRTITATVRNAIGVEIYTSTVNLVARRRMH